MSLLDILKLDISEDMCGMVEYFLALLSQGTGSAPDGYAYLELSPVGIGFVTTSHCE
jgi:hypothetical protein